MTTKTLLLLMIALCIASLAVAVPPHQDSPWQTHTVAGAEALQQRQYAEAQKEFAAALKQAEHFGAHDPKLLISIDNLATAYHHQKKYAEAEPLYLRALTLQEAADGPEHPRVAARLQRLADLYNSQPERKAEAELLLLRALAIKEKATGSDNSAVAFMLIEIAYRYGLEGRDAEAEPLNLRGLAVLEKLYGADAPILNTGLTYLAAIRLRQGKYDEVAALYQRVQQILEKSFVTKQGEAPARAPEVSNSSVKFQNARLYAARLSNLTGFHIRRGQYAEAEAQYQHALTILEQEFGANHQSVGMVLEGYARLLRRTNRMAEAVKMEERARSIKENTVNVSGR